MAISIIGTPHVGNAANGANVTLTFSTTPSTEDVVIFYEGTIWEDVTENNVANANTDFTLTGVVANLTNYKDANNIISCRVYQEAD